MQLNLSQLEHDIMEQPTWIKTYYTDKNQHKQRAIIRHPHWSITNNITPDDPIFTFIPQKGKHSKTTLIDIPWNPSNPSLLEHFNTIIEDHRLLQTFLQTLQLLTLDTPMPPAHLRHTRIHIPVVETLLTTDPRYPNDYLTQLHRRKKHHFFYLQHTSLPQYFFPNGGRVQIDQRLPNHVPQKVVHAIQRLYSYQAIPGDNQGHMFQRQYPLNSFFTTRIPIRSNISQHRIIDFVKNWQHFYPDIPIPRLCPPTP